MTSPSTRSWKKSRVIAAIVESADDAIISESFKRYQLKAGIVEARGFYMGIMPMRL